MTEAVVSQFCEIHPAPSAVSAKCPPMTLPLALRVGCRDYLHRHVRSWQSSTSDVGIKYDDGEEYQYSWDPYYAASIAISYTVE
nr:hypothetical protein CFP56_12253 [Quercus suber]